MVWPPPRPNFITFCLGLCERRLPPSSHRWKPANIDNLKAVVTDTFLMPSVFKRERNIYQNMETDQTFGE